MIISIYPLFRPNLDSSLVPVFYLKFYSDGSERERDLLGPFDDDYALSKVILPTEIGNLRALAQTIKIYMKDRIFSLIDIDQSEGRTANLVNIAHSQPSCDPLGEDRFTCPEFSLKKDNFCTLEALGEVFCQKKSLFF